MKYAWILLLAFACQPKGEYVSKEQFDSLRVEVENLRTSYGNTLYRVDDHEARLNQIMQAVVYIDSVNTARGSKSDRAERRGRFFGGLLKTLLP